MHLKTCGTFCRMSNFYFWYFVVPILNCTDYVTFTCNRVFLHCCIEMFTLVKHWVLSPTISILVEAEICIGKGTWQYSSLVENISRKLLSLFQLGSLFNSCSKNASSMTMDWTDYHSCTFDSFVITLMNDTVQYKTQYNAEKKIYIKRSGGYKALSSFYSFE